MVCRRTGDSQDSSTLNYLKNGAEAEFTPTPWEKLMQDIKGQKETGRAFPVKLGFITAIMTAGYMKMMDFV